MRAIQCFFLVEFKQTLSKAMEITERRVFASCFAFARVPKQRREAALRRTLVMIVAAAAMAACAMPPERNNAQPSGQQTCNVAGKFCDTFFGP